MTDFTDFPIARLWPATFPDRLQLYSFPTPNGMKISAALEELEIPYEAHRVDIMANETWTPEFLSLNPNGKIPAIIDPDGPGGKPIAIFESNAILLYLAEKTGRLLSADPVLRYETLQWLFLQSAAIGPMFGQVGFFYAYGGRHYDDKRPLERFLGETKRLLALVDDRLADRKWIMGDDFSIADLSIFGWVRALITFYDAREVVGFDALQHVPEWLDNVVARPAVHRGLSVPA